jgi:hypothetical protein
MFFREGPKLCGEITDENLKKDSLFEINGKAIAKA